MTGQTDLSGAPLRTAVRNRGMRLSNASNNAADSADVAVEYRAFHNGAALADVTGRSRIELSGNDRAAFLNNFCTNDVRRLQTGDICEAFLTSVQGKTLGHIIVLHQGQRLLLEAVPNQESRIQTHLEKYVIREDVVIASRTADTAELLLIGPDSLEVFQRSVGQKTLPSFESGCRTSLEQVDELWVHRLDVLAAEALLLICNRQHAVALCDALLAHGATPVGDEALELLRVESGWPCFGRDFDEQSLPQEIGRDAQAISFTKGCYLGQETVARIDALGHVNRKLVGVRFGASESDRLVPLPFDLTSDGKCQGKVTSLVRSPSVKALLGLAMVRAGYDTPGSQLSSPIGPATVVALPFRAD